VRWATDVTAAIALGTACALTLIASYLLLRLRRRQPHRPAIATLDDRHGTGTGR
jgi:hypothetical protein